MTTFADLQQSVLNNLHSQTADQEQRCALTQPIGTTDTSFTVDDVQQISRGLIEIDSELLWVKSIDTNSGTVTISPFGRGYGGTTAATHAQNAMVVNGPRFPKYRVQEAITDTLNALYPDLYQVKKDETKTAVSTELTYAVPADVGWIIRVEWQTVGPTGLWKPIRRWKFDPTADTTAYSTGKSIDIYEPMTPGRTIKVTYASALGTLSADTDTLASTGLDDGSRDVVVFGACARLLQSMEAARLEPRAVEQSSRAALTQPGSATNASRAYWALFATRLQEEKDQLQRLYPTFTHITR